MTKPAREITRAEARQMFEERIGGKSVDDIAEAHGLDRMRVQRRLYSMGIYMMAPRD